MLFLRAARPGLVSLDALAELFLAHLKQRFPPAWQANNLLRAEHGPKPACELYGPEPAAGASIHGHSPGRYLIVIGPLGGSVSGDLGAIGASLCGF